MKDNLKTLLKRSVMRPAADPESQTKRIQRLMQTRVDSWEFGNAQY
jgi:hypothetical protein